MPAPTLRSRDHGFFQILPLEVVHIKEHGETVLHAHDFSELVIVLGGSATHISPGGEYTLGAGDVFVLHGNQAHGYKDTASLELVNIMFRMDQLTLMLRDVGALSGYHVLFTLEPAHRQQGGFNSRLRLSSEQLNRVRDRVSELIIEHREKSAGWQFAAVAQFMLIVSDLCRFYSQTQNPAMRSLLRLGTVIEYMHQHYAERITLDDLASIGNMSRRTLTRQFTRALGVSPIEYLIQERVNRARDLLGDKSVNITEVAYRVGFGDSNYFSRAFRALVGHAPRDVRREALRSTEAHTGA